MNARVVCCSSRVYSQVYENFHARPGWRVVSRTDSYARDYSLSRFCLAAPGGGWGKRGIVAAMYGCIPVSATDFLFEVGFTQCHATALQQLGHAFRTAQAALA